MRKYSRSIFTIKNPAMVAIITIIITDMMRWILLKLALEFETVIVT